MRYNPYPYQQYCENRVISDKAVGLMLDMGLGKTVITLSAIKRLKLDMWRVSKVLIVAPKKVAEATWQTEAAKWDHLKTLRFSTVLGSAQQRIRALNKPADIYVTSRDLIAWLAEYYRQAWPFDMVVLDESSSFKNHRSQRFKAVRLVRSKINRIVELTGTPAPNGLIDLWAQMYLLDGGVRLGKTIGGFRDRYFLPDKRNRTTVFSYKAKTDTEDAIKALIGGICVSMKAEDYLSLPDCIDDDIPVELDPAAKKAYDRLERDMLLEVDEETVTAGTAAVLTNKLLQLCNGAVYSNDGVAAEIHGCKLEAFSELVEQLHGEHALVFYSFKHDLTRLTGALAKTDRRVRVYDGPEAERAWNAGEIDILLAHPASCAYGLNLQHGGHHIIWFGLTWSLEQYQQANKRLHRQGQDKPVLVHHLITRGGVDEDVISALQGKSDTQEALMQALKARIEKARNDT